MADDDKLLRAAVFCFFVFLEQRVVWNKFKTLEVDAKQISFPGDKKLPAVESVCEEGCYGGPAGTGAAQQHNVLLSAVHLYLFSFSALIVTEFIQEVPQNHKPDS